MGGKPIGWNFYTMPLPLGLSQPNIPRTLNIIKDINPPEVPKNSRDSTVQTPSRRSHLPKTEVSFHMTRHIEPRLPKAGLSISRSRVMPRVIPDIRNDPHHVSGRSKLPHTKSTTENAQGTTENAQKHKKGHNSVNMAQNELKIAEMDSTVLISQNGKNAQIQELSATH